ncbi:MAG: hypothetical protein JJT95_01070 [Pararhodobacter sp.]|nr:hypothetical protein [Pararhodobacter sp.]
MQRMRIFALTLLALAVMASSVTMVQARHQARGVGEVVLCTGYGMVSVEIDAEGNPVGPMLPCPDCIMATAALDTGPATAPHPVLRLVALAHALRDHPAPASGAPVFRHARAPPVAV